MTRNELINFSINQKWRRARIDFLEEQIKTIGRLTATLSDMPKGSRKVYDTEAESLTRLMDQIKTLESEIEGTAVEEETRIKEILEKLEPKHRLLLYYHYVLGKSIGYISTNVLFYQRKYIYDLKKEALEEFEAIQEKKG